MHSRSMAQVLKDSRLHVLLLSRRRLRLRLKASGPYLAALALILAGCAAGPTSTSPTAGPETPAPSATQAESPAQSGTSTLMAPEPKAAAGTQTEASPGEAPKPAIETEPAGAPKPESETLPAQAPKPEVKAPPAETPKPEAAAQPTGAQAPQATTPPAGAPGPQASPPSPASPKPPPRKVDFSAYRPIVALLSQTDEAQRKGDLAAAEKLYDQVLEKDPMNSTAMFWKLEFCRKAGRHAEALVTIEQVLAKAPKDENLLREKAASLFTIGESQEALATLQEIFAQGNRAPAARYLHARILASLKDREGTLSALHDAVEHSFTDYMQIEKEALFEFLENDGRFTEIVSRLKADSEEKVRAAREEEKEAAKKREKTQVEKFPVAEFPADHDQLVEQIEYNVANSKGQEIEIEATGLDGELLSLADHRGKPVVLEFWGTWTHAGMEEMQHLSALKGKNFKDKGLVVLTFAHEPDKVEGLAKQAVQGFLRHYGLKLPCAIVDAKVAGKAAVARFPTTVFVGADGKSYLWAVGYKDAVTLEKLIDVLLKVKA